MRLSFHNGSSLVEVVGSLRFNAFDNPNPLWEWEVLSVRTVRMEVCDDPNVSLGMVNISQGNDSIGRLSDDIQVVHR